MRYLFINTHYLPDYHYGGIVESGSKLLKFLRTFAEFKISTVSRNPAAARSFLGPPDRCYRSLFFHRFGFSLSAVYGLFQDLKRCDAALINGIFTFPVTLAALYAALLGKPFIVATRGGLEPWCVAHKRWKKYFYIRLITLPLMRLASHIHVTSDREERNIRALGFNNIIKISNGIDPEEFRNPQKNVPFKTEYQGRFIFLFLSRTDKEKGLDILIAAYRDFRREVPQDKHILVICGPDHQGYFKNLHLNLEQENIAHIPGAYGPDKIRLIRQADVAVLPSYSENFGNIVAEALACERPVITTTGTPWNEIEKIGCGLCIGPNARELSAAMHTLYQKTPAERAEMGRRGRHYILENFSWETKAKEMFEYLRQLAGDTKAG